MTVPTTEGGWQLRRNTDQRIDLDPGTSIEVKTPGSVEPSPTIINLPGGTNKLLAYPPYGNFPLGNLPAGSTFIASENNTGIRLITPRNLSQLLKPGDRIVIGQ